MTWINWPGICILDARQRTSTTWHTPAWFKSQCTSGMWLWFLGCKSMPHAQDRGLQPQRAHKGLGDAWPVHLCTHSTLIHRLRMFFSFPHSCATNLWVRNHVRIKVAHCSIHLSTHWNCGACSQLTCQSNPVTKTLILKVSSSVAMVGPTTYLQFKTHVRKVCQFLAKSRRSCRLAMRQGQHRCRSSCLNHGCDCHDQISHGWFQQLVP